MTENTKIDNVNIKGVKSLDDAKGLLQTIWSGDVSLSQMFWMFYFLVVLALKILGAVISPLGAIFGFLTILWAGFMVLPIIRAADKYEGEAHWALLAKIAAIVIGLCVIGDLLL